MVLKLLRKKKTMKIIMWGIAIIIIPAFVIWGSGSSDKDKKDGPSYAGKIFNKKISFDEYTDMWYIVRDNLIKTVGKDVSPKLIDKFAWDRILLVKAAKKERINVSDKELLDNIISFPIFQRNGGFDKELYRSMLGDSAKGFEERVRDEILIEKLRRKIMGGIFLTEEEIKNEYRKENEKIRSSYISMLFSDFEKDVSYKEEDLTFYYENGKELFREPEQRNMQYTEANFSDFNDEIFIEEKDIKRHFEENIDDFKKEGSEEMPVLTEDIKNEISKKLKDEKKASLAEDISYKILDAAFEKQSLVDAAKSFGFEAKETGFFSQEKQIPGIGWSYDFARTAFELEKGAISNRLICTENAFYAVQLKEIKDSYIPVFSEIKDDIISSYIKDESINIAKQKAEELYNNINDKIKEGKKFEDIVKELGIELKTTDLITRSSYIPALGPAREFVETSGYLKKDEVGRPIKMLESWVILKLDEYQGIDEDKFLEEKAQFENTLLSKKSQFVFNAWFEDFKKDCGFISYTSGKN
ncbi:MAG: SurA N-terminal domain-containing protein [Candidatus Omnitrophota bacterium]